MFIVKKSFMPKIVIKSAVCDENKIYFDGYMPELKTSVKIYEDKLLISDLYFSLPTYLKDLFKKDELPLNQEISFDWDSL